MVKFVSENVLDFQTTLPAELSFSSSQEKIIFLGTATTPIKFIVEADVELKLTLIFLPTTSLEAKSFAINFEVKNHAHLNLQIANLANKNLDDKITIDLVEENSGVEYYSASILNAQLVKNSVITVRHLARNTSSNIKAYEVLKGQSKGFIRCISDIKEKSSGSEAHQELRLLVLDKAAKADSDPVLLIDENDIVASHANAIGMLDPDQVFYLKSRGLNETQAQELIVNGYFEPIFLMLADESLAQELKSILKGMI